VSTQGLEQSALEADLSGDVHAAVAARRELVHLDPASPAARMAYARALERASMWSEAAQAYAEALQRGARPAEAHRGLGDLHLRRGKFGLALQHLRKSLAASAQDAGTFAQAGIALHRLRRFRESRDFLQRAVALTPEAPELHFNLGLARFECGDLAGAADSLAQCRALKRGRDWTGDAGAALSVEPAPAHSAEEAMVNDVKLRHDIEQLEYLLALGRLPPAYGAVAAEYRALLDEVKAVSGADRVVAFNPFRYPLVARTYKRPLHLAPAGAVSPMINPKLDAQGIQSAYARSRPNLMVVDDLLTPEALRSVRRYCRESTVWHNIQSGYLGAYFHDGFACELLLQLARELRDRFARVIGGHALQMLWGYKYDHELNGIGVHADAAAVNVNFWITEDEANLDPAGGGLLVYRKSAPADWDFEKFNRDPAEIFRFLGSAADDPIRIPHRANRAVIFDSDLFHATDTLGFREGYLNRRINITLLYGLRSA
jgi:Flp pilus assembly protein TadD